MAERNFLIVVVCLILFNSTTYAQQKSVEKFTDFVPTLTFYQSPIQAKNLKSLKISLQQYNSFKNKINTATIFPVTLSIAPDFYSKNLGFFCQRELQFEKATSIPLRFRLGSVAYTDYLEQKPNALPY